jgi:DNA-nicking Smr family endonuclease
MSRARRALTREELKLWAHVARQVTPLAGKSAPVVIDDEAPQAIAEPSPSGDPGPAVQQKAATLPPLAPLERRMRQRVARGISSIDGTLDLHGLRQDEAHRVLLAFLSSRQRQGASLVLVITGKGGQGVPSPGMAEGERGVLRRLVPLWLGDPRLRRTVLGFENAARGHGGEGALYVRLRKPA